MFSAVPLQQPTRLQARIDTAYSTDWTPEEQVALDATLDKYPAARHSALERYLRAAAALPKKTARDVALRVRWLATSAHASKRRLADDGAAKKRPRVQSIFAVQPKGAPPLGIPAPGVPAPGVPIAMPPLQQVSLCLKPARLDSRGTPREVSTLPRCRLAHGITSDTRKEIAVIKSSRFHLCDTRRGMVLL